MSDPARFVFSSTEGRLEIVGSELFVSQQVEALRDVLLDAVRLSLVNTTMAPRIPHFPDVPVIEAEHAGGREASVNPYPRVLDVLNDKVKVTKSMKGANTAEKAVKLILAYMWGKERLLGQATADYRELRDLCEQHACLDSSNFSTTLAGKKSLIVVDGGKGSSAKICKLTVPGKEKAEEYLREMNEG